MIIMLGGIFLGWALGSNDAANVFGTAVGSRIIRYRTAVILAAIFIVIGAVLEGGEGIKGIGRLAEQTPARALIITVSAGITVTIMSSLRLPVSATQAVVGAIIGMGFHVDPDTIEWPEVWKMLICWLGTPTLAAFLAFAFYPLFAQLLVRLHLNLIARSFFIKSALIVAGCYGAYALGANNVGNVMGVYYRTGALDNVRMLALVGGASIALGVLTYSKNVMLTVGSKLTALSPFSALVTVVAMASTVHLYAKLGVPVSSSQAIVGGVLGVGLFKGARTINRRTVVRIFFGWINTPVITAATCWVMAKVFL